MTNLWCSLRAWVCLQHTPCCALCYLGFSIVTPVAGVAELTASHNSVELGKMSDNILSRF